MAGRVGKAKDQKRARRSFFSGAVDNVRTANAVWNMAMDPKVGATIGGNMLNSGIGYAMVDKRDGLDDEMRGRAKFAQAAYVPWKDRPDNINGAWYNIGKSNDEVAVYTDEKGNHHVASRGTVPGTSDFSDDAAIVASGFDKNHSRVQDVLGTIKDLHGDPTNTTLYGHSLGGSIASLASGETGIQSYNFNTGSSPLRGFDNANSHHFLIRGDPISNSALGNVDPSRMTLINRPNSSLDPHTINQFA